ncbi:hypothetical protein [uncultured Sphaerochaeta sp.]|uniref:hypothetical protein n=1 Tax=uncultured Sphaerochaeta sp. TaxID=886478 RepID=UPI002A0A2BA1|nr:hypothetical protein [uncultured Sphaerochaeta sp.]
MKKRFIALLLGICLLISIESISATANKETPDFRNSNWGDTMQDVAKSEGKSPDYEGYKEYEYELKDNPYFDKVHFYFGDDNTLASASYTILINDTFDYSEGMEEYKKSMDEYYQQKNKSRITKIKAGITKKYGEGLEKGNYEDLLKLANSSDTFPSIELWNGLERYWVTENTIICLYNDPGISMAFIYYIARNSKEIGDRGKIIFLDALI